MRNVLLLTEDGQPAEWISAERAITLQVSGKVIWEIGDTKIRFHGGYNKSAKQSVVETSTVIAIKGSAGPYKRYGTTTIFSNKQLFARDNWRCCYCGDKFATSELTREHVIPRSKGGKDVWENVATCCLPCNSRKGDRYLHQTQMKLQYQPYAPSYFENFILKGRNLFKDQAEYLENFVSSETAKTIINNLVE